MLVKNKASTLPETKSPLTKSFLKWAGGKWAVLPKLKSILPEGKRLIEPFCGSGVVSFNLKYPKYLLADTNADLIRLFSYLKQDKLKFIRYCQKYFTPEFNSKAVFLELRDTFNTTQNARLKAALFLYLNKHAFNGLCRFNSSGDFNVSFGKYKKPYFPEKEMVLFAEFATDADFRSEDFVSVMQQARRGDVVYCDPPYTPLSKTANFVSYGAEVFSYDRHLELVDIAKKLRKKGVFVAISNHDSAATQKLYHGARIYTFKVQRYISCKGNNRGKASELIAVYE